DGDDDLAVLHAGQVLYGTRDSHRDIELGCDDLAGLADLVVVGYETGIDRGARCADRGVELVGQRFQDLEVFPAAHAASTRDDDARSGELRASGLGELLALNGGKAG